MHILCLLGFLTCQALRGLTVPSGVLTNPALKGQISFRR